MGGIDFACRHFGPWIAADTFDKPVFIVIRNVSVYLSTYAMTPAGSELHVGGSDNILHTQRVLFGFYRIFNAIHLARTTVPIVIEIFNSITANLLIGEVDRLPLIPAGARSKFK